MIDVSFNASPSSPGIPLDGFNDLILDVWLPLKMLSPLHLPPIFGAAVESFVFVGSFTATLTVKFRIDMNVGPNVVDGLLSAAVNRIKSLGSEE